MAASTVLVGVTVAVTRAGVEGVGSQREGRGVTGHTQTSTQQQRGAWSMEHGASHEA